MHTHEIEERQQQLYSEGEEATKIGDQESLPRVKVVLIAEEGASICMPQVKYKAPAKNGQPPNWPTVGLTVVADWPKSWHLIGPLY